MGTRAKLGDLGCLKKRHTNSILKEHFWTWKFLFMETKGCMW